MAMTFQRRNTIFIEETIVALPCSDEAIDSRKYETLIPLVEHDRMISSPGIRYTLPRKGHRTKNSDQISGA